MQFGGLTFGKGNTCFKNQIQMDEFVARFCEGGRGFGFSHTNHVHIGFPQAHGEPGKIAVAGDETETVYIAGIEDVHRVDDHRHVGRIFARGIVKLLNRCDGILQKNIFTPAVIFCLVTVDAAISGKAVGFDFIKNDRCISGTDVF